MRRRRNPNPFKVLCGLCWRLYEPMPVSDEMYYLGDFSISPDGRTLQGEPTPLNYQHYRGYRCEGCGAVIFVKRRPPPKKSGKGHAKVPKPQVLV